MVPQVGHFLSYLFLGKWPGNIQVVLRETRYWWFSFLQMDKEAGDAEVRAVKAIPLDTGAPPAFCGYVHQKLDC
jgi:hypothetical protein